MTTQQKNAQAIEQRLHAPKNILKNYKNCY